jgi:zinc protease
MDVRRTDVDGIPVFWVDSSLPYVCSIFVRMGGVDETLVTAGMAHLLEHLVLRTDWPVEEFNATVTPLLTHYWFGGDEAEATSRLEATVAAMGEPPLGRFPREREILRTEAYGQGHSQAGLHGGLRFGPRGPGIREYPELGIQRATRADVLEWAQTFFVSGNVAVSMTKPPPEGLRLTLPDGASIPPPALQPIPYLEYPASFVHGPDGAAGASMLVRRSHEIMLATDIALHRLRQWLRHQEGVTYHVGSGYEPISADEAQLVLWADCRPESAMLVRNALVAVLDDLASTGPTEEELHRTVQAASRSTTEPTAVYDTVAYSCAQQLVGQPAETVEEMTVAREALTSAQVAAAVAEGFENVIVSAPIGTSQLGGRFKAYPIDSPRRIKGTRYSPVDKTRVETLVVGEEGIAIEGTNRRAVAYEDAAAFMIWDDGSVGVYGSDGFYVLVDPAEWKKGDRAAAEARRHVDPRRAVDVSNHPPLVEDPDMLAGLEAYENEDWVTAIQRLEAGLTREPENATAWGMLAWALHRSDVPHRSIEAARTAVRLDPHNRWSARFLATALLRARHYLEAVDAAREALRRAPVDLETLSAAADIFTKAGYYEDAERVGRRAAEMFPDESSAWFAYGWSARAASNWTVAEPALRRAVALDPQHSMWHNNLGVALLEMGRPAEALTAFDRALALRPENEFAPVNRARALHQLGKTKEAARLHAERTALGVENAARLLEHTPRDPVAIERLARALLVAERDGEASERARQALEIEPTPSRYLLLADSLAWLGRWDEARGALEAGLELDPDHAGLLEDLAWLGALTGDREAAARAVGRIEAQQGTRHAMFAHAYAAGADANWIEAERRFDELVGLKPLSCCARAWRGIARLGQGKVDEARLDSAHVRATVVERCASLELLERQLAA